MFTYLRNFVGLLSSALMWIIGLVLLLAIILTVVGALQHRRHKARNRELIQQQRQRAALVQQAQAQTSGAGNNGTNQKEPWTPHSTTVPSAQERERHHEELRLVARARRERAHADELVRQVAQQGVDESDSTADNGDEVDDDPPRRRRREPTGTEQAKHTPPLHHSQQKGKSIYSAVKKASMKRVSSSAGLDVPAVGSSRNVSAQGDHRDEEAEVEPSPTLSPRPSPPLSSLPTPSLRDGDYPSTTFSFTLPASADSRPSIAGHGSASFGSVDSVGNDSGSSHTSSPFIGTMRPDSANVSSSPSAVEALRALFPSLDPSLFSSAPSKGEGVYASLCSLLTHTHSQGKGMLVEVRDQVTDLIKNELKIGSIRPVQAEVLRAMLAKLAAAEIAGTDRAVAAVDGSEAALGRSLLSLAVQPSPTASSASAVSPRSRRMSSAAVSGSAKDSSSTSALSPALGLTSRSPDRSLSPLVAASSSTIHSLPSIPALPAVPSQLEPLPPIEPPSFPPLPSSTLSSDERKEIDLLFLGRSHRERMDEVRRLCSLSAAATNSTSSGLPATPSSFEALSTPSAVIVYAELYTLLQGMHFTLAERLQSRAAGSSSVAVDERLQEEGAFLMLPVPAPTPLPAIASSTLSTTVSTPQRTSKPQSLTMHQPTSKLGEPTPLTISLSSHEQRWKQETNDAASTLSSSASPSSSAPNMAAVLEVPGTGAVGLLGTSLVKSHSTPSRPALEPPALGPRPASLSAAASSSSRGADVSSPNGGDRTKPSVGRSHGGSGDALRTPVHANGSGHGLLTPSPGSVAAQQQHQQQHQQQQQQLHLHSNGASASSTQLRSPRRQREHYQSYGTHLGQGTQSPPFTHMQHSTSAHSSHSHHGNGSAQSYSPQVLPPPSMPSTTGASSSVSASTSLPGPSRAPVHTRQSPSYNTLTFPPQKKRGGSLGGGPGEMQLAHSLNVSAMLQTLGKENRKADAMVVSEHNI